MSIILFVMVLASCSKEESKTQEQIDRETIQETENLLRDHTWGFNDLLVDVKFETRAIPLLANVADENGYVQAGTYDSYDIYGSIEPQLYHSYQFSRDLISQSIDDGNEYNRFGRYFVVNTREIRISPDVSNAIRFDYSYAASDGVFTMTTENIRNEKLVNAIDDLIVNAIFSGAPGKISDAVVERLLESEKVKEAISQMVYDLIHGKISEIAASPEEIADELARRMIEKLKEIDFEDLAYDKILEVLERLQVENPEETAAELAKRISEKIEAGLTQNDIYEVLLPIMQSIEDEALPIIANRLAEAVYSLIAEQLSEENLYQKVYDVWENLSRADSSTVVQVADTLANVTTNHFFEQDSLTQKLIPFVSRIDETIQLGALAQEIIDDVLIPTVDRLNEHFPNLNLDPNWNTIKPIITSALTVIKAQLGSSTVEELSEDLAESIIGIMESVIQKGFETAIYKLQEIPSEQAALVVSSWIVNLVEMAEEPIVEFVEAKLNEILAHFDAEKISRKLSFILYRVITENLSEENLFQIILPILERLNAVDMEELAQRITEWLMDSGIVEEIDEEMVQEKIAIIIAEMIGNVDPDQATEILIQKIKESGIGSQIDGEILSRIIELKLYQFLIEIERVINSLEQIELSIIKK